jgi:hypothetical protein
VIAPLANVVLADVREQDAGSASGVLNTGFQLGNSIGLAFLLMLALPARRGHNQAAASV